jgi:hypothetical protein
MFDVSALNELKRYRFKPGTRNGNPVDTWVTLPVKYDLKEKDSALRQYK